MMKTMSHRAKMLGLMQLHPEFFTEQDIKMLEIFIDEPLACFEIEGRRLTLYPDDTVLIQPRLYDDRQRQSPRTVDYWVTHTLESIFDRYDPDLEEEKRVRWHDLLGELKEYLDQSSPEWWRVRLLPKYFQKEAKRCAAVAASQTV